MNICFFFNVCRDENLAERLMGQIHRHYPGVASIAVLDGDSEINSIHGTKIYSGRRLKQQGSLGLFIRRNFSLCLEQDADIFVGLDPDTFLWRPFDVIPSADWFGQVNWINRPPFIGHRLTVGACAGYSRKAINSLLNSGLLDASIVDDAPTYRTMLTGETVPAEDYVIGWALESLGFEPVQWKENSIRGTSSTNKQSGPPYRYAATHPCKAAIDYTKFQA